MSQDTFPFADIDNAAPYVDEADPNRNKMLIGGGLVAALAIAAGGYFLLGSGSSSSTDSAFVVPHHATRTVTAPAKTVTTAKKLPAPYKAQLGRDPFKALYVVPAAAPAAAAGTTTAGSPTGVTPPGSTVTGVPTTGTTGTGTGSTPVTAVNQQYKLVLLRVYGTGTDRTAVFSIDGKQQVAKIGTKFGPTSEIVLLSMQQGPKAGQWTTVLQVGDGDPFDVVTGTPAYVR